MQNENMTSWFEYSFQHFDYVIFIIRHVLYVMEF